MKVQRLGAAGLALATSATVLALAPNGATAAPSGTGSRVEVSSDARSLGVVNLRTLARAAAAAPASRATGAERARYEFEAPRPEEDQPAFAAAASSVGTPGNTPVVEYRGPGVRPFDGLNAADSRLADNGNQYTNEPPDGAICEGKGVVVELVNSAAQFFTPNGQILTVPLSANELYGLPPSINREKDPPTFPGPSLGDPRCLYDAGSGRHMLLFWGTGQNVETGAFTGRNTFYLAVQAGADPLGAYHRFAIDVSRPGSAGCRIACLADFPMLGSDKHSVVISWNDFRLTSEGEFAYNRNKLLVLSKRRLTKGRMGEFGQISVPNIAGFPSYTLQPAAIPPGGSYDTRMGGTEWLLSSIPTFRGTKLLGLAALTNTAAVDANPGAVRLSTAGVVGRKAHAIPVQSGVPQKPGPRPLGTNLRELFGVPDEPLPKLDAGYDKASTVQLVKGKLYTSINTDVGGGSFRRAGQLLTAVRPGFTPSGGISGAVTAQNYVAVADGSALYGDIAVTADGRRAAMVASYVSPKVYPSGVLAKVNPNTLEVDHLNIYRRGAYPEDGFSCYAAFGGGPCRWGDYSEINVGTDGDFYMETEYITDRLRISFANWGTALARLVN